MIKIIVKNAKINIIFTMVNVTNTAIKITIFNLFKLLIIVKNFLCKITKLNVLNVNKDIYYLMIKKVVARKTN